MKRVREDEFQQSSNRPTVWWRSWKDVPDSPPDWVSQYSVFLEVFSGTGNISKAMKEMGWLVLPPIDIDSKARGQGGVSAPGAQPEAVSQPTGLWALTWPAAAPLLICDLRRSAATSWLLLAPEAIDCLVLVQQQLVQPGSFVSSLGMEQRRDTRVSTCMLPHHIECFTTGSLPCRLRHPWR